MGDLKTILLTGGNGFLGSHLLRGLIENGYEVIVLLRPSSDTITINEFEGKYKPFVLSNTESDIKNLFEQHNFDVVINTATEYGHKSAFSSILQTNVIFPVKLLEEAKKKNVKLFINTDSFFAKKRYNQSYLNSYTFSKRMLESVLKEFSDGVKIVNMRIEHVYGEGDSETKFVTAILKKILQNHNEIKLTIGTQKRDFVYVKDVVNAYLKVLQEAVNLKEFTEFEVGTGKSKTVKEFVEVMAAVAQSKSFLNFGALPVREGDILESMANIAPLNNIGWTPIYPMAQAIKHIIIEERKRFNI